MSERTPPQVKQAIEAEQALVGSLILNPRRVDEIADLITAADFYDEDLGKVYSTIVDLYHAGQPVSDVSLLVRVLERNVVLQPLTVGTLRGRAALAALTQKTGSDANAVIHAREVLACARLRSINEIAAAQMNAAYGVSPDYRLIAEEGIAKLEAALTTQHEDTVDLGDIVCDEIELIEQYHNAGKSLGVSTSFDCIDEFAGFFPGEVTVLAARPSVGKTALAMDIALRIREPSLFVSIEMTPQQISHRILQRETGISVKKIRNNDLAEWQRKKISEVRKKMRASPPPMKILSAGRVTPQRIAARARLQRARFGLSLLVIDYLQLLESTEKQKTIYERVTAVSRQVKLLAITLNVPVLLIAQLNRDGANTLPQLHHLKDSGAIEQDADNVWFLHREDNAAQDVKLIIAKQRQGELGTIDMQYRGHEFRFYEQQQLQDQGQPWEPSQAVKTDF